MTVLTKGDRGLKSLEKSWRNVGLSGFKRLPRDVLNGLGMYVVRDWGLEWRVGF